MVRKKEEIIKGYSKAASELEKVAGFYERRGKVKQAEEYWKNADKLRKSAASGKEVKASWFEKTAAGTAIGGVTGGVVSVVTDKLFSIRFSPGEGDVVSKAQVLGVILIIVGIAAGICWFLVRHERKRGKHDKKMHMQRKKNK